MAADYRAVRDWLRSNGYQYWCFVSWARGPRESRHFVECLRDNLRQELLLRVDSDAVFLDIGVLSPGDPWPERLQQSLCRSVLMVPVYTPPYFWPEHRYCGLEWGAMHELSTARLGDTSCLYPVILRAQDQVPDTAGSIQWTDLSAVALRSTRIEAEVEFRDLVTGVATRAIELGSRLMQAGAAAGGGGFAFPEASPFDGIYSAAPVLPFRGGL